MQECYWNSDKPEVKAESKELKAGSKEKRGVLALKNGDFSHYSKYLTVDSSLSAVFFVSLCPIYAMTVHIHHLKSL
jgi:hypothetical protein